RRTCRGESARRLRNTAISSSRKEICAVRLPTSSSCREPRPLSSLATTALTSSRGVALTRPYLSGGLSQHPSEYSIGHSSRLRVRNRRPETCDQHRVILLSRIVV